MDFAIHCSELCEADVVRLQELGHITLNVPLWMSTAWFLDVAAVCFVSELSELCAYSL